MPLHQKIIGNLKMFGQHLKEIGNRNTRSINITKQYQTFNPAFLKISLALSSLSSDKAGRSPGL